MLTPEMVAISLGVILGAGVLLALYALMAGSAQGDREYESEMFRRWREERARMAIPPEEDVERDV